MSEVFLVLRREFTEELESNSVRVMGGGEEMQRGRGRGGGGRGRERGGRRGERGRGRGEREAARTEMEERPE